MQPTAPCAGSGCCAGHDAGPAVPPLEQVLRDVEVKHENFHKHDERKELEALTTFRASVAFVQCAGVLFELCDAVRGRPSTSVTSWSPAVDRLCRVLARVEDAAAAVEPVKIPTRFGNPAFKTLIARLRDAAADLSLDIAGSDAALPAEVVEYLLASLGDATRVDYGTGHELNALCFVTCLRRLALLDGNDMLAVGVVFFPRYFQLVRTLQKRYCLEPAGSRGCWGLDDYQFLPFLLGAAQLSGHPRLRPKSVLDAEIREAFAADYLYLSAIAHVFDLKLRRHELASGVCSRPQTRAQVASFAEHSPMLYDITAVKDWASVHTGLLSMYNREVLGKAVIVQHFRYGQLLSAEAADEQAVQAINDRMPVTAADRRMGPVVAVQSKVVCCSDTMHFPSSLAAK